MTDSITLRDVVHAPLPGVPWARRAKIPLGAITGALVAAVRADAHAVPCAEISGRARDGGPAAGTVTLQGRGWAVVAESAASARQ